MKVEYFVQCNCCGDIHTLNFEKEDFIEWKNGKLIQNAMPYLSAEQRELLISKTCPICWDRMFA